MGSDLSVSKPPIYRTTHTKPVTSQPKPGENNSLLKNSEAPHGKVRTDHYATGDGSQQTITQVESAPVQVGSAQASVAVGKDVRQDRTPGQDPTVVDVHLRQPVVPGVEVRGRVRTSTHPGQSSCQGRVGVQGSVPVGENGSVYVQSYVADKISEGGKTSGLRPGVFAGYQHKITPNVSAYIEGQVYDVGHVDKDHVGVNAGIGITF